MVPRERHTDVGSVYATIASNMGRIPLLHLLDLSDAGSRRDPSYWPSPRCDQLVAPRTHSSSPGQYSQGPGVFFVRMLSQILSPVSTICRDCSKSLLFHDPLRQRTSLGKNGIGVEEREDLLLKLVDFAQWLEVWCESVVYGHLRLVRGVCLGPDSARDPEPQVSRMFATRTGVGKKWSLCVRRTG